MMHYIKTPTENAYNTQSHAFKSTSRHSG